MKNACRLALLLSIPLAVLIGLPSLLPWATAGLQFSLAAVLFIKNICATSAFTSAVLMVNAIGICSLKAVGGKVEARLSVWSCSEAFKVSLQYNISHLSEPGYRPEDEHGC